MKLYIKKEILLILVFFNVNQIYSQQSDTLKIEFEDLWNIALNNNIELQDSELTLLIAEKVKKQSFALPKTEFSFGRGYVNAPDVVDNSYNINQNFGSISTYFANSTLFKNEYEKAKLEKAMVLKRVKYNVELAYNTWFFSVLRLEILNEQTKYLQDLANYSAKRYKVGDIHSMENNINQMNFLEAQNELINYKNNYLEADMALRKLILYNNEKTLWPIKDIENIKHPSISQTIIIDSLFIQLIDKSIEIEGDKISLARSEYFPELSLSYTNQQLETVNSNNSFMVGVAIPLWFAPQKAEVQKAKISLEKEKLTAKNRRYEIINNLRNSKNRYDNYSKQLDKIGINTYHQAQKFREQLYTTYKAGEISGYQFSQSLNIYFNILSNYLSLVEKYNAEIINLKFYIDNE